MYYAPTSTADLLAHVVRGAEEAGYHGLLVALLRNADARGQLAELSEEWTSMHDVTGRLIAVLSPQAGARGVSGRNGHRDVVGHAAAFGLRLLPGMNTDPPFELESSYVRSLHAAQISARAQAWRPRPPEEHRDAWTEAASRCASYFGIAEAQIPAVLLLSFPERTAVLIRLRSRSGFSVYDLCKKIAADLGWTKEAAGLATRRRALHRDRERLDALAHRPRWRGEPQPRRQLTDRLNSHMTAELREQYDGLDRHLRSVTDVAPELVGQWRENLAESRSRGTVEQAYRQLFAIRRHTIAPADRHKWQRLAAKVGKVIAKSDRVIFGASGRIWNLDDADPIAAEMAKRRTEFERLQTQYDQEAAEARQALHLVDQELRAVTARLAEIDAGQDAEPGLAEVAEAAACDFLGPAYLDVFEGSAGLTGYTVHAVRVRSDVPDETVRNSVSGHVGTAVQIGRVDGDVHIHPPRP